MIPVYASPVWRTGDSALLQSSGSIAISGSCCLVEISFSYHGWGREQMRLSRKLGRRSLPSTPIPATMTPDAVVRGDAWRP
jgi:hypothetical protein